MTKIMTNKGWCCARCGRNFIENNLDAFPLDPPGTDDRRWVCGDCQTKSEFDEMPEEAKSFVNLWREVRES